MKSLLVFPKGLLGGVVAVTITWLTVLFCFHWRTTNRGHALGAVSGGWQYLAHAPWVILLLSVAFGLGFYVVVTWIPRHP